MNTPQSCPICNRPASFLKPVFEEMEIRTKAGDEPKTVSGMRAFICTAENHIFFVRAHDLDTRKAA